MLAKRERAALGIVLAVAAVLRLMYLLEARTQPDFFHPGLDAAYHDYWARGLAFGAWSPPEGRPDPQIRSSPYFRPPGYPFLLAAAYKFTGGSYTLARLLQMALGLFNIWLAYRCARLWLNPAIALVVASLCAIYWGFIFYEAEFLDPTPLITLGWLALYAISRSKESGKMRWSWLTGLGIGLAAVFRPNYLVFLPVAAAWLAYSANSFPRWRLKPALAAITGALVVIAPVTMRNYLVARDFVLISSNGGINLLLGQDPDAAVNHASLITGDWSCFDYPSIVARASQAVGRPLKASEASRWYATLAVQRMRLQTKATLRLTFLKALLFWGPLDVSNNKIEELDRAASWVLRWLPIRFAFILGWAVPGTFAIWRSSKKGVALLIWSFVLSLFVSYLPFIAAGQYRVPLTPMIMTLSAAGLVEVWNSARKGDRRGAVIWAVAGLVCWSIASINFGRYRLSEARWHLLRGAAYERAKDFRQAEVQYRKAAETLVAGRRALGILLAKQERYAEAIPWFEAVLAEQPDSVEAMFHLGLALALGQRVAEAIPYFEEVLRRDPHHEAARQNLAIAYRLTGRTMESPSKPIEPSP